MALYQEWTESFEKMNKQESANYFNLYLAKETEAYKYILENKKDVVEGTIKELSDELKLTTVEVVGFIDGINESLKKQVELDELTEESTVRLEINFEALYRNMLDVPAEWLYGLPEWENIYAKEELQAIKKAFHSERQAVSDKIGRNAPCPCGSGKKYKKCCGKG